MHGMAGYTKLWSDIVNSTIWREEMHVKIVWITMLALSDQNGLVMASVPGLADASRVSLDECVDALDRLKSPDKWSRTKEHEGRRAEDVEGGWLLLNHEKHRSRIDSEKRKEQVREAVRRHRQKAKEAKAITVIKGNHGKPRKSHTDTDTDTDTDTEAVKTTGSVGQADSDPSPEPTETPVKVKRKRGARIDPEAFPKAVMEDAELFKWAATKGVTKAEVLNELETFTRYWAGRVATATKLDWRGTFQNRIQDQVKSGYIGPDSKARKRPPAGSRMETPDDRMVRHREMSERAAQRDADKAARLAAKDVEDG